MRRSKLIALSISQSLGLIPLQESIIRAAHVHGYRRGQLHLHFEYEVRSERTARRTGYGVQDGGKRQGRLLSLSTTLNFALSFHFQIPWN
jgi:hypothetical protein